MTAGCSGTCAGTAITATSTALTDGHDEARAARRRSRKREHWRAFPAKRATARRVARILWRNQQTGALQLWLMDYWFGSYGRRRFFTLDSSMSRGDEWRLAAVGDYNADGHTDLLWLCVADEGEVCGSRTFDLWTRRAPNALSQPAEPRPAFEFVRTCDGELSYQGRDPSQFEFGDCAPDGSDNANCVDPTMAKFVEDAAGCVFPSIEPGVLGLAPFGPR
jgi:hypothetical protein